MIPFRVWLWRERGQDRDYFPKLFSEKGGILHDFVKNKVAKGH